MSYLTDTEKRLLFSALRREKEVCQKVDDTKVEDATCKMLVPIVNSLEKKFYYDRFEKEIRDKVIEEFSEKVISRYHELPTTLGYTNKIIREIAEQMKEVGE